MQLYCTITAKSGKRVPLVLAETAVTPTQLRQQVSQVTKIPLGDLRLIFRGRMIKDDDSIASVVSEYKLEGDSVLHCMGKPVEVETGTTDADSNATANATANANARTTSSPAAAASVPNRTTVPPLSTATTRAAASAATSTSTSSSSRGGVGGDPLSRALTRLKQNNPPSVYVTAVGTLEKVLTNIANNPMEEKYRRVKRQNAAFGKRLGKLVGGHDCMLATGFVVEHQSGEEVYQLHASADKWNALLQAKARVSAAASEAKLEQEQSRQRPSPGFGMPLPGAAAAPGMGGFPPTPNNMNMNDPNLQNMMSQMMSNPEALGRALQVRKPKKN